VTRWGFAFLALWATGCLTVDSFFFQPSTPTDGYDFESGTDGDLDGSLTDPHPSTIDAAHRTEGFEDTPHGRVHWVFARQDGPADAVLYSHGNADHLGRYWDRVERLYALGVHVLIYDYPGYGLSEGEPSEEGTFDAAQVALERLAGQPDVERVFLYGYSLGGAPTYEMAARSERGDAPTIEAVISEAAWCSVEDLLQDGAQVNVPGHYATRLHMDSCARVAELERTPLLLMHGTEDGTITVRHMDLLVRSADGLEVRAERVEGATHNDLPNVAADYDDWVRAHLAR